MFNQAESALLKGAPAQFPIIAAASAALKRCGTCGHKDANIYAMLHTAALMYRLNPKFSAWLEEKGIQLPCTVAGVRIGG